MRVKICGMCTPADIRVAIEAGADAVGFVFAKSTRQLSLEAARPLIRLVPAGVLRVGVMRSVDSAPLDELFSLGLDAIQIERDEQTVPTYPLAIRLWSVLKDSTALHARAAAIPVTSTLIVDSATGGGSGQSAELGRVAILARERAIILAGGLSPDTVGDAIARVCPCGVDVSSGVESAPGIKDPELIHAFVRAAREAAASLPEGAIPSCP
jgi:phosphoribosylanthranilate isomerase